MPIGSGAGHEQVSIVGGAGAGSGKLPVVGGAWRGQVPVVDSAGSGSSGSLADDSVSVPAVVEKQRDGVAYVLNDEILSVGIVDVNRSVLRGHKIEKGFVCVLITYIKNYRVPAPVILGDPEENRYLQKGMYFPCLLVTYLNAKSILRATKWFYANMKIQNNFSRKDQQ